MGWELLFKQKIKNIHVANWQLFYFYVPGCYKKCLCFPSSFSASSPLIVLLDVGIVVHTSDGVVECEVLKSVYQDKYLIHYYTWCATMETQCVEIDII